jgi:hypothetical protein
LECEVSKVIDTHVLVKHATQKKTPYMNIEKNELEEDLTIEEVKKTVISIKSFKSPGGDGIISEFYQLYWEAIEKDFFGGCR